MKEISLFREVQTLTIVFEQLATSVLHHHLGIRSNAPFVSRHRHPLSLSPSLREATGAFVIGSLDDVTVA